MKKTIWLLFAFLAVAVSLYPLAYFWFFAQKGIVFGLLESKSPALLADVFWRVGFFAHIGFGGLALAVGWANFSKKWRAKRLDWHRRLGKIYVASALLSAAAGFGIAFSATGGPTAKIGFASLAVIWFSTTLAAFLAVRKGQIEQHEKWMILSYAACFAAVTLRIWLPLLVIAHDGAFVPAYRIVAWASWMPNLLFAAFLIRRKEEN